VPALRGSNELPEAERTRGVALAERLSMPVLARAWQILLKGTQEVEGAPDRRAAAEMVLIRLCHAADLPPPGELVRRLTQGGAGGGGSGPEAGGPPPGGGMRAVAGGAPVQAMAAVQAPNPAAHPMPRGFREAVALAETLREQMLHAHLLHSVHLVRFAAPVIELRPEPGAPRDLAARFSALLSEATGTRWTIALSAAAGEPTLAEQGNAADAARRSAALQHPMIQAILEAFPGARVEGVHDATVDRYGLPADAVTEVALGEPDMPEFAPPDASPADMEDLPDAEPADLDDL
jgi:DNA polymerase-3 subunit gamma/tau